MKNSLEFAFIAMAGLALLTAGCAKKTIAAVPKAATPTPVATAAPARTAPPVSQPTPTQTATNNSPARSGYPDAATQKRINDLLAKIEDAYFNYNDATLRPDATKTLASDSTELRDILKDYPSYRLTIEGHCDERGSAEYNMALGDKRADSAKEYLSQIGIPATQLHVISYGKEQQVCSEHDEACWQKNRRIHIVAMARN